MFQGWSNKEIAHMLGKAGPTAKHQVSSILRKFSVSSRSCFIAFFHEQE